MESLDTYRTSLHKKKIQQYYQPNGATNSQQETCSLILTFINLLTKTSNPYNNTQPRESILQCTSNYLLKKVQELLKKQIHTSIEQLIIEVERTTNSISALDNSTSTLEFLSLGHWPIYRQLKSHQKADTKDDNLLQSTSRSIFSTSNEEKQKNGSFEILVGIGLLVQEKFLDRSSGLFYRQGLNLLVC